MTWRDEQAERDINRMLAAKSDTALEYAKSVADENAVKYGLPFVVIGRRGHYQIWHKWIADKYSDGDYMYQTDGG